MSMMSIFKKKSFYIILVLVLAIVGYSIYVRIMNDRFEEQQQGGTASAEEVEIVGRKDTYDIYLENHKDAIRPDKEIIVDLFGYSDAENVEEYDEYEGRENVLVSQEGGFAEWTVNVPKTGLYNINMDYFPMKSREVDIERALFINGEIPFAGADALTFTRVWTDAGEVREDNRGNEIRPHQIEAPRWVSTYFTDSVGYFAEPYRFYLNEGDNVIRLEAVNEPIAINRLVIGQQKESINYDEFIASFDLSKYQNTDLEFNYKKQGEDADYRSSPTLYAIFDRASSNTEPYSAAKIKLNNIGGIAWSISGQWIEWEFEVPEDGLYNISYKARQNYNRGMVSTRKVTIDGVTPFNEVSELGFKYNSGWELTTLADASGIPYKIPLAKGKHVIRLEVTLGDLGDILSQIEASINRVNEIYRKILVLTGSKPDPYRDYRIDKVYPGVMVAMEKESAYMDNIVDQLIEYTGQKGSESASVGNLSIQLKRFLNNPDTIPRTMENFRQNISSLGTAIINLTSSPLDIDFLYINADSARLPDVEETFFGKVAHELRSFTASFFEDYSTIGNYYEGETIEVWLLSGRDQSTILKNMIDENFTPEYGINVNVKLIDAATLLPAVVAGTGPDVALTANNGIPVDYALRGATVDLTQFEDFEEVKSEYFDSAFVPYEFEGGIYGLPETQNFNVLFYRTDIMEEIGAELPTTWDEVIELLPILQKENMQFGLPSTEREINGLKNPDFSAMMAFFYQNGGTLYSEDLKTTMLDEEISVEAFERYTMMYTHYGLPKKFDFVNRFRSGEMPIGVADYNIFNTLSVFAPEIRGLWDFAMVPGTVREDGTIDNSVSCWGEASILLKNAEDYEAGWKFLKWWASAETKARFGRELESIMGASARYPTANKVAFKELAWSSKQAKTMEDQWQWVDGTPQAAGGYSTMRHMINAFRKVTNEGEKEDPRETLLDYTRTINEEIKFKRKELRLDVD